METIDQLLKRVRDYDQHTSDADIDRLCDIIDELRAEIERLRAALTEAMRVRHFCDMEQSCEKHERDKPYTFDEYLRRWAEALGERVYSDWPNV